MKFCAAQNALLFHVGAHMCVIYSRKIKSGNELFFSPKGACATCSPKGACAMVHSFNDFEGRGGGPLGALFLKSRNLKKRNILDNFYLMENPKIL